MKKVLALFVILTAVFFAACGKKQEQGTGSKEKVVVVSQGAKPKSLDPYMYNEIPGLAVTRHFMTAYSRKKMTEVLLHCLRKVMNIKHRQNFG